LPDGHFEVAALLPTKFGKTREEDLEIRPTVVGVRDPGRKPVCSENRLRPSHLRDGCAPSHRDPEPHEEITPPRHSVTSGSVFSEPRGYQIAELAPWTNMSRNLSALCHELGTAVTDAPRRKVWLSPEGVGSPSMSGVGRFDRFSRLRLSVHVRFAPKAAAQDFRLRIRTRIAWLMSSEIAPAKLNATLAALSRLAFLDERRRRHYIRESVRFLRLLFARCLYFCHKYGILRTQRI
jgi:hypothetical protein